ncbi:major facilitator superfamily domain-containing protein [Biscogniauxia marginata]|nr:major facilitator superfamily domain-containing protein [Biscogniauxia marginata]
MADERRRHHHISPSGEPAEDSPLLREEDDQHHHHHRQRRHRADRSPAGAHVPKARDGAVVVNMLCVIIFVATSATGFIAIPFTRLAEDVLCRRYYGARGGGGPIDEGLCKEDWIQGRLAFVLAIQSALEAVAGLLAAFPWGLAADRIGRRPVFAVALGGMVLALFWMMLVLYLPDVLPIELVWLGSASPFVGGGQAVLVGVVLSMITDETNEDERAIAFMRLHAGSLCGNLMSPALSSLLMEKQGPWPPIWVAVALLITSAVSFLFLPETLRSKSKRVSSPSRTEPAGLKSRVSHTISTFRESLSILKSPSLILLLLTALGSMPITHSTLQFMAQFISKRYGIKLFQTGYVQSAYGVAQIVQALVILPFLSKLLLKSSIPAVFRAADEHHRDLSLSLYSYVILFFGILVLGFSPSLACFIFGLVLMALGSGFGSFARSLMSLYVDPEHRSRLFSLVGMVEVVGSVYAQPMLAGLFALGMKLGGGWIGLPYYGLSVLVAICGSLLLFVRLPKNTVSEP